MLFAVSSNTSAETTVHLHGWVNCGAVCRLDNALLQVISTQGDTVSAVTDVNGDYAMDIPVRIIPTVEAQTPELIELFQNYPNPFNPQTTIRYRVKNPGPVSLEIFSINGQRIRTLREGQYASGEYVAVWDGTDDKGNGVAAGVYLYCLETVGARMSRKMLLLDGHTATGAGRFPPSEAAARKPAAESATFTLVVTREGFPDYGETDFSLTTDESDVEKNIIMELPPTSINFGSFYTVEPVVSDAIYSYPGGGGVTFLELKGPQLEGETFEFSVVDINPLLGVSLFDSTLTADGYRFVELNVYPDSLAVPGWYILPVSVTHEFETLHCGIIIKLTEYTRGFNERYRRYRDEFIDWLEVTYPAFDMPADTEWFRFCATPNFLGGVITLFHSRNWEISVDISTSMSIECATIVLRERGKFEQKAKVKRDEEGNLTEIL